MWPAALLSGYIELHGFLPGFGNIGCKDQCRFKPEVPRREDQRIGPGVSVHIKLA
jgi:hypothetical protein